MSKHKPTVTLVKKSSAAKASPMKMGKSLAAGAALDFEIQDNGDLTFTVFGKTQGGNRVDISDVATLTASSSDPSKVTLDPPPVGMSGTLHAVGPLGSVVISLTAAWNDGSVGPFSFDLPGTVKPSAVGGLEIELGTPTVH